MIKKGYCLHVTSWENDGDNYNTEIVSGLSLEKTQFFIKVLKLFESESFGNSDITSYEHLQHLVDDMTLYDKESIRNKDFYEKYHPDDEIDLGTDEYLPYELKKLFDEIHKEGGYLPFGYNPTKIKQRSYYLNKIVYIINLIGDWMDGERWRVFESFKVYYYPEDIIDATEYVMNSIEKDNIDV